MWNKILNPFFVFTITWSFVIFLLNLNLTSNINRLEFSGLLIIYLNIITSFFIYLLFYFIHNKRKVNNINITEVQYYKAYKFANRCFNFFLFLTIIDIFYSGGVPLIWIFTGSSKNYVNLGIPSIRGLQYTLYLFTFSVFLLLLKTKKFKNSKLKIIILSVLPFLMLSRSLMIYCIFQLFYLYIFDKKIEFRQIRNIIFFIFGLIIIFGLVGDIRGPYVNPFAFLINETGNNPLEKLPSGFTWIYIYITANFNNILLTIGTFEPSYSFFNIFYNIIPGFLKQFLITDTSSPLITDESLNVASFYAGYVTSFGIIGGVLGGIMLQFIGNYFYFKAKNSNLGYLTGYSIVFTCIILSVFFDALMTISTISGLILSIILANKLKKV
jgi:oligosaccharide repeat unit polymerase